MIILMEKLNWDKKTVKLVIRGNLIPRNGKPYLSL